MAEELLEICRWSRRAAISDCQGCACVSQASWRDRRGTYANTGFYRCPLETCSLAGSSTECAGGTRRACCSSDLAEQRRGHFLLPGPPLRPVPPFISDRLLGSIAFCRYDAEPFMPLQVEVRLRRMHLNCETFRDNCERQPTIYGLFAGSGRGGRSFRPAYVERRSSAR